MDVAFAQLVCYIGDADCQSKTSEITQLWNDLRSLQGIGSALIEFEGRSVFSGILLTELLTNVNNWQNCPAEKLGNSFGT